MTVAMDTLYGNLNDLLGDICKFLSNADNYGKLSSSARKQADKLICRSKTQLQEIIKCRISSNFDATYVDMDPQKAEENDEENEDNIYSSAVECQSLKENYSDACKDIPAQKVKESLKYGFLSWRCRIIFRFEKMRGIFGGLHNNCLLLYNCEKDLKPLHTIDLSSYTANPGMIKQNKNPPLDFELVSNLPNAKTYYFMAQTNKDMLQWVSYVNKVHNNLNNDKKTENSLEIVYQDIPGEMFNTREKHKEDEDEEEPIYIDVLNVNRKHSNLIEKPNFPKLPHRYNYKINVALPPIPMKPNLSVTAKKTEVDQESIEDDSFSESNDEDEIYNEVISTEKKKIDI